MTNNKIFKLVDLIEDIKKVDEMIVLHQKDLEFNIMLSQYQAKKVKLTTQLITELTSPEFKSTNSLLFIKHFLDKFYSDAAFFDTTEKGVKGFEQLEAAL
ncbi:MAG: hypothetical protein ABJB11_17425 [Ferruginibacter sp.]